MHWALCLVVISALAFDSACEDDTLYKVGKPAGGGAPRTDGGTDSASPEMADVAAQPDGSAAN